MSTPPFQIGDKPIGPGHPVFVIAEIGYNFNTLDEARASIDAAIDCGADAVKFQTFTAATVASRHIEFPGEAGSGNQFEEFERYQLSADAHRELFAYGRGRGTVVLSTPSYYDDVALLEDLCVPVYKIGSDDLTNLPFIAHVARIGKPMILSTGMSTLSEVAEAVEVVRETGNHQLALLHCVSNYPVRDPRALNLRAIEAIQRTFAIPVGLSDHTMTPTAALGAVALGACIVERHFTLSKDIEAPDAPFSADPAEMRALVAAIRELEAALGDGNKRPAASEIAMRRETRKGAVARSRIAAGEAIRADQIIIKRPGTGVSPRLAHLLEGRRALRDIEMDEVITWDKLG